MMRNLLNSVKSVILWHKWIGYIREHENFGLRILKIDAKVAKFWERQRISDALIQHPANLIPRFKRMRIKTPKMSEVY
jgi:hypothetical protein